jgi:hypothetical protein
MQNKSIPGLSIILWATCLNYLAQVPYYFHNSYFPYHIFPSISGILLLGMTLAWFLVGYIGFQKKSRFGYPVLVSFLTVEALFYFLSVLSGAFIFQLENPSVLLKIIFLIGYISGGVAGYFAYTLIRYRKNYRV